MKSIQKNGHTFFNLLFDEELKEQRFKIKLHRKRTGFIFLPQEEYKEYSFWQFGDELVKMGIGYWSVWVSESKNVHIEFVIPNFIYEAIQDYKTKLPIIENFEEKINEIKREKETKRLEKEWNLEDFEETEAVSEVLESEIEASIISNPEILEEGLELVGNQYPTSVGYIDILCKDKNGNFVVIELKRGTGSYKVVGQIQKYMAWVSENLAKDKQVRGIIVVKEYDQELEYAVKGSKFPIEIKIFGQEPPTGENIKYCTRCGKPNPKSAKYCIKCGQEFWM
ncbi:PDDEXK nuclease domain-containing protein [Dehalococcoidia bacterium]|nr:PDDEXK nuclease domain-containing protein [Dehalococcoidia bacterium]MCL0104243.1 PDDEXK nuclease domain-containing protein [Dehalococcoidia bacterium]